LIAIRREQPVLRRRRFFRGRAVRGAEVKDIAWLEPSGNEMTDESWNAGFVRSIGVRLEGNAIDEVDQRGHPIVGDTLLVLLNGHHDRIDFTLPDEDPEDRWERLVDTTDGAASPDRFAGGNVYPLTGRSVALFRLVHPVLQHSREVDVALMHAVPEAARAQPAWAEAQGAPPKPAAPGTPGAPEPEPEPVEASAAPGDRTQSGARRRKAPADS